MSKKEKKRSPLLKGCRPRLSEDETNIINEYRRFHNGCIERGLDPSTVKHGWIKDKEMSLHIHNPNFEDGSLKTSHIEDVMDKICKKYILSGSSIKLPKDKIKSKDKKAVKVTISDSHVGMNPNPNNNALFNYEYNTEIYNNSIDKVFNSILKEYNTHGLFDLLLLDDLGDLADGWNGYTTRGGHALPQNMSNAEVFETCVDAKVRLISNLVESRVAKKIILRCVVNDNHSGDFSLIINKAVKKVINLMFKESLVSVDILTRFIEHRTYGDHCFILTHGKDKEHMKSGLPIVLNDRAIRLITDYIEHYSINSKYIHVEKGDLHQIGYQKVKKFDYRNFMSFAPPSAWIQHNFGDSYSGYSIQVIPKYTNEISHTDYFLEYEKSTKR